MAAEICTGVTTSTGSNWISANGICVNWFVLLLIVTVFFIAGMFVSFLIEERRKKDETEENRPQK